jgi:DNA-binding PadR family transcriptional regulator
MKGIDMRHARHAGLCGPGRGGQEHPLTLAMAGVRGGGPGGGSWGWGFGPGSYGGFRGGPHGRGRKRRGDVRAAILLLLAEEPRNGYGVMQEVEERSHGEWRPSPGSIYPALSQLEDEGLIAPVHGEQGKAFALTDAGREYVEEHRERLGTPWETETAGAPAGLRDLKQAIGQLAMASMQVAQTGDPAAIEGAKKVLDDARRALYRLLAGDDDEEDAG